MGAIMEESWKFPLDNMYCLLGFLGVFFLNVFWDMHFFKWTSLFLPVLMEDVLPFFLILTKRSTFTDCFKLSQFEVLHCCFIELFLLFFFYFYKYKFLIKTVTTMGCDGVCMPWKISTPINRAV